MLIQDARVNYNTKGIGFLNFFNTAWSFCHRYFHGKICCFDMLQSDTKLIL